MLPLHHSVSLTWIRRGATILIMHVSHIYLCTYLHLYLPIMHVDIFYLVEKKYKVQGQAGTWVVKCSFWDFFNVWILHDSCSYLPAWRVSPNWDIDNVRKYSYPVNSCSSGLLRWFLMKNPKWFPSSSFEDLKFYIRFDCGSTGARTII